MTAAADIIPQNVAVTLAGLFRERVRRSPNAIAYREFDQRVGAWRARTWHEMDVRVGQIRAALAAAGLKLGDRIAIALPNCADWVAFDIAALSLGLVVVPLYVHDSAANMAFILTHSGARLLVIDTEARWSRLLPHWPELLGLEHIWIRDGLDAHSGDLSRPGLKSLDDVLNSVTKTSPEQRSTPDALATIIYTSGTTGQPKGTMLSNRAVLWNAEAAARVIPPRPDDVFLSCLPLAHAFERTVGYYLPMIGGATVAYARSIEALSEDFRSIRPTVFLGVPRLYERACTAIRARAHRRPLQRALLDLTANQGWKQFESRAGTRQSAEGAEADTLALSRPMGGRKRAGRIRWSPPGGGQRRSTSAARCGAFFDRIGSPTHRGLWPNRSRPGGCDKHHRRQPAGICRTAARGYRVEAHEQW